MHKSWSANYLANVKEKVNDPWKIKSSQIQLWGPVPILLFILHYGKIAKEMESLAF